MFNNEITKQFLNQELTIIPNGDHEFLMSTEQVAIGYDVNVSTIRSHKSNHKDEIKLGSHFITVQNIDGMSKTLWTKNGVIRLGFFIKSERAKKFRDWCENVILNEVNKIGSTLEERALSVIFDLQKVVDKQRQRLIEQEEKITEDEPKVEWYSTFQSSKGCMTIAEVANVLGIGRNHLFLFLREQKVLMSTNRPYQYFIERGYFRIRGQLIRNNKESVTQCLVTAKGMEFIKDLLKKSGKYQETLF